MDITITINTDNAAFEFDPMFEVAHILRKLADKAEKNGELPEFTVDTNGNRVGKVHES